MAAIVEEFYDHHVLSITWFQVAHSVQQCVYRCAVHWRRITAKRVRDRGGKPRPRPVIEEKSDRPFPRVSCPINPVPSTQPAAYSVAVDRYETFIFYSFFPQKWGLICKDAGLAWTFNTPASHSPTF